MTTSGEADGDRAIVVAEANSKMGTEGGKAALARLVAQEAYIPKLLDEGDLDVANFPRHG